MIQTREEHEAFIRRWALRCGKCEVVEATKLVTSENASGTIGACFGYCDEHAFGGQGRILDVRPWTREEKERTVAEWLERYPFREPVPVSTVGMVA